MSSLGATQSPERKPPWCDQLQHPTTQSRQVEVLDFGDGDDNGIYGDHNHDRCDHDHDSGDHDHNDLDDSFYDHQDWGPWRNVVCPRWRIPGQKVKHLQTAKKCLSLCPLSNKVFLPDDCHHDNWSSSGEVLDFVRGSDVKFSWKSCP